MPRKPLEVVVIGTPSEEQILKALRIILGLDAQNRRREEVREG